MKILIYGVSPWVRSAYGKNCKHIALGLNKLGFEVEVCSYYGIKGESLNYYDVLVHPCYGDIRASEAWCEYWYKRRNADIVLQHFDTWALSPNWITRRSLPVVTYAPIDCEPMSSLAIDAMRGALTNVAMSTFVRTQLQRAGLPNTYIPHGVDTSIYKPMDKTECRKHFGLPPDRFIFGSVSTNVSARKNLPNQLKAYKLFLDMNPGAEKYSVFYLHTAAQRDELNSQGYDLPKFVNDLDLGLNVVVTDKFNYYAGYSDEEMAKLYNCFDVLMQCSLGEGFGVPIIEAGACGVPTIGSDFSSIPGVMGDGGVKVRTELGIPWQITGVWQRIPVLEDIVDAMSEVFGNEGYKKTLGEKAYENAQLYSLDKVLVLWGSLFLSFGRQFGWIKNKLES